MNPQVVADTVWVLIAGMLVWVMDLGFAMIEVGFCRARNAVSVLGQNFAGFCVVSIAYWAVGFAFMFGSGGIVGQSGFLLLGPDNSPATGEAYSGVFASLSWAGIPLFAKFFFMLAFAGAAAAIVPGAVAERVRILPFLAFTLVMSAILYPTVGHWIWGGGFLAGWGMFDFAGSTAVHSVGGWAALAGVLVLGPRLGRYRADGKVNPMPGHNMALATMGAFILWFGWFGFNPGSTMAADPERIGRIAMVTNMAGAAGGLSAFFMAWALFRRPDLSLILNGSLAGLVGVTAGCAWVTPAGAAAIGVVAGILVVLAVPMFDRLRIDDPVGALPVHLVNGIWGTLAVGLFAAPPYAGAPGNPPAGLLYGGSGQLLLTQFKGVLVVGAFMLPASLLTWSAIRALMGLRAHATEELTGLDRSDMGMEAYPVESLLSAQTLLDTSLPRRPGVSTSGYGSVPLTVAFPTPAPAFPMTLGTRGPGHGGSLEGRLVLPGNGDRHHDPEPREAEPGANGNGNGHEPPSGRRFTVQLENIDRELLAKRWRALCQRGQDAPPEFQEVYPRVVSLSGNSFHCMGGDPEAMRRSFERIFQGHGRVGTVARVVI